MMTIGSSTGAGNRTNPGSIGMGKPNDSVSKGIQQQIANAQKRLQEISSDDTLSMEEKMKKRQEIQQEITNLNQQLRQHQMEMRKEQQAQQRAAKQQSGGVNNAGGRDKGISSSSMQSILSADSSMKQAQVQGSQATKMQGRAGVLKTEIKLDAAKGGNTRQKEEELSKLEGKIQAAQTSQISSLSQANKAVEEAAKAEQNTSTKEPEKQADKETETKGSEQTNNRAKNSKTDSSIAAQQPDAPKQADKEKEDAPEAYVSIDIRM